MSKYQQHVLKECLDERYTSKFQQVSLGLIIKALGRNEELEELTSILTGEKDIAKIDRASDIVLSLNNQDLTGDTATMLKRYIKLSNTFAQAVDDYYAVLENLSFTDYLSYYEKNTSNGFNWLRETIDVLNKNPEMCEKVVDLDFSALTTLKRALLQRAQKKQTSGKSRKVIRYMYDLRQKINEFKELSELRVREQALQG